MDITMCKGTDCPIKKTCYRFTAISDEYRQSYFVNPPIKDNKCEMYWGGTSQEIYNQLKEIINN